MFHKFEIQKHNKVKGLEYLTSRFIVLSSARTWSNPDIGARKIIASTVWNEYMRHLSRIYALERMLTIVKERGPRRYTEISISGSYQSVERLTSLTPTSAHIHNPPFSTAIPARGDLHFKSVLRDTDRLESCFKHIIVRGHIFQRRNTLKVIQKA